MSLRRKLFPLLVTSAVVATVVAEGGSTTTSTGCSGFFGCNKDQGEPEEPVTGDCTGFGCPEDAALTSVEEDPGVGFKTIGSCTTVSFEMTTDSPLEDVSFDLICNDAPVWTYPSAVIPTRANGEVFVKSCVFLQHACCHFNVHSLADSASLELQLDGESVLSYNSVQDPPFTNIAKSFGQTCQATPEVNVTPKDLVQDVDCKFGKERPLQFKITLDEHPEQISWFLVCHDPTTQKQVTVFDTPRGSLAGHVGQTAEETACIPYNTTCAFTIVDSAGDGLTTAGSGYTLTIGVSLLDAYTKEPFSEKSYCIGDLCGAKTSNAHADELDEEPTSNTEVTNVEGGELKVVEQEAEHLQKEIQEQEQAEEEEEKELEQLEEDLEEFEHKETAPEQNEVDQDLPENLANNLQAEDEVKFSEPDNSSAWLVPTLTIVAVALVFAGMVTYFLNRNSGTSSSAAQAISPMKDGKYDMDETDTDEDSDTFVLDA